MGAAPMGGGLGKPPQGPCAGSAAWSVSLQGGQRVAFTGSHSQGGVWLWVSLLDLRVNMPKIIILNNHKEQCVVVCLITHPPPTPRDAFQVSDHRVNTVVCVQSLDADSRSHGVWGL